MIKFELDWEFYSIFNHYYPKYFSKYFNQFIAKFELIQRLNRNFRNHYNFLINKLTRAFFLFIKKNYNHIGMRYKFMID